MFTLPYKKTGYFSKTALDYLEQSKDIQEFYGLFPTIKNFKKQLDLKTDFFDSNKRKVLVEALKNQYKNIKTSNVTQKNINLLLEDNTFTITTGHQLNLFTGPLYFLYKIISTINLCEELKTAYPKQNFVPIYWISSKS